MARIFEVNFKLGAQIASSFSSSFKNAKSVIGALKNGVADFSKEANDIKALLRQQSAVDKSTERFQRLSAQAEELRASIRALGPVTDETRAKHEKMTRQLTRLEQETAGANTRMNQEKATLKELNSALNQAGRSTDQLRERQAELARQAQRTRAAQAQLAAAVSARDANSARMGAARGALVEAAAIGASLAVPIRQSVMWEQSLAELNKVADLTPEQLDSISTAAQNMAVQTGVAREEIIGAYTAAAQAGFARDEWEQFAEISAKMGVAFDVTGDQAGEMLKAWRSGMALTMEEAELLAAASNHLANNMNATASDVGEVLQRQGAVLKAAGIEGADAAALSAALLSGGASPEIAATAAKNFAKALSKGDAVTGNERQALAALGFGDPAALARMMQEAPREAIIGVLESMQGLAEEEQLGIMAKLFGSESIGAIAPLIGNLDNLKNAFNLVGDSAEYAGSLQAEFDAMGNTSLQNSRKFSEQMKILSTQLGDALKPAVTKVMAVVMPLAARLSKWIKDNPKLVSTLAMVTAGIGALTIAVIAGTYAFTAIRGAFLSIKVGLLAVKAAAIGANVSLLPIIAAIAALVAVGYLVYKNWDKIKVIGEAMWPHLKTMVEPVKETFLKLWESVKKVGDAFFGAKDGADKAGVSIETLKKIGDVAGRVLGVAFNLGFAPLRLLGSWIADGLEHFAKMVTIIKSYLAGELNFFEAGKAIIRTLIDGIKAMAGSLVDTVKGVFTDVRQYLPFSDAKEGPFSQLTASGAAIMQTLGQGIQSVGAGPLVTPFADAAAQLGGGLAGAARGLSTGSSGAPSLVVNQTINLNGASPDVRADAEAGARAGLGDMLNEINKAFSQQRRLSYG